MKIIELLNRVQLPITNEEADLLGRFTDTPVIPRDEMSERDRHVANQLVNKDVLLRNNRSGQISYKKKTPN